MHTSQPSPPTPALPRQYLTFQLGGEAYALGILSIKEIIECTHMIWITTVIDMIIGKAEYPVV